MAKLDSQASIEKIVSNTVNNSGETEKKTRTREPKEDQDKVDLLVYRAILRATCKSLQEITENNRTIKNGALIGDLLLDLPRFGNDAKTRLIVNEAIDSLVERKLVKSLDHGAFRFVSACNGGHYNEITDFDCNGVKISTRVVTNFFSRNENPLKRLYLQQKAKAEAVQIQSEREFPIDETQVDDSEMEEWQEPEFEFADDDFVDSNSELNSDLPE
jgi:hypothetical protein